MFKVDDKMFVTIRPELLNSYPLVGRARTYKEKGYALAIKKDGATLKIQNYGANRILLPVDTFQVSNDEDMKKVIRLGEAALNFNTAILLENFESIPVQVYKQVKIKLGMENESPCWEIGNTAYPLTNYPDFKALTTYFENSSRNVFFADIPVALISLLVSEGFQDPIEHVFEHAGKYLSLIYNPCKQKLTLERKVHFSNVNVMEVLNIKSLIVADNFDQLFTTHNFEFDGWHLDLLSSQFVHSHFHLAFRLSEDKSNNGYWLLPKSITREFYEDYQLNRSAVRLDAKSKEEAISLVRSGDFMPDSLINFHFIRWEKIETAINKKISFRIHEFPASLIAFGQTLTIEFDGLIDSYKTWKMPMDDSFDQAIKDAFSEIKEQYLNVSEKDYIYKVH